MSVYTELQVTTNFSFLRGASHAEELVAEAARLGYDCIAVTDRNTLAGVVRAYAAAKKCGVRVIVGCRLDLIDGPSLLAYPTNKEAYARLSNLLTLGNSRAEKGECLLYKQDVYAHAEGMQLIVVPPHTLNDSFDLDADFITAVKAYRNQFDSSLSIAAVRTYTGDDHKRLYRISELCEALDIAMCATNDVHYHCSERRQLQDIVTCIREKCTIYTAGYKLHMNAERYLKPEAEMKRLFRSYPEAIERTQEIAKACTFSLDELQYEYPEEITSEDRTPMEELRFLAWKGAEEILLCDHKRKTERPLSYSACKNGKSNLHRMEQR